MYKLKPFCVLRDQANDGDSGGGVAHQSTPNEDVQQDQNISILENSNTGGSPTQPDNWEGDIRYFQTGKKAGQLKPSANPDAKAATKSKSFSGLNLDELKATNPQNNNTDSPQAINPKEEKAKAKAERKSSDARTGAKIAMRILDTLTKWISKGTYGANFTPEQRRDRNEYREELENDWREYLLTLDIPLHPALIVAFGSLNYVGDAFTTEAGQERAQTIKEKIISKIAVGIFSRGK